MQIYLVGGAVRDLLLGTPPSDRDYLVTGCTKEAFQKAFPKAKEVGLSFPVFLLDKSEFAFPRGSSLDEELRSRDLTVNAQLLDEDGCLICHPRGLEDLNARILRPASPDSIGEDPLRVYRAARFSATLPKFTPHAELKEAMAQVALKGLLETIAPDRIGNELRKALIAPQPGNFLRLLRETGGLSPWFNELHTAASVPAGPPAFHDTDTLEHTCRIMDALAGNAVRVWMGLCHDLGKTLTPKDMQPHHYGHDRSGINLAKELADRLRLPSIFKQAGMKAAEWHMTAAQYGKLRPGTKVKLLMSLYRPQLISPLFQLVKADHGLNYEECAQGDLHAILNIRLEKQYRNQGHRSGDRLFQLRAEALSRRDQ